MSNEQTVSTTDAPPQAGPEDTAAPDTLDALLAQYAEDNEAGQTDPSDDDAGDSGGSGSEPDLKALQREIKQLRDKDRRRDEELMTQRTNEAVSQATKAVLSAYEGNVPLDDEMVEAWLLRKAETDQRMMNAFLARDRDRDQWNKVLKAAGRELSSKFAIDAKLTGDRASVETAVRGATRQPPQEGPNVETMSDSEFEQFKRSL